jgi:glycosyltransferase involved in cell wall biosynthesis
MRILLTSSSMGIGGAERVVAMLAAGLAAQGHEIVLAAPPGERDADLRDLPQLRLPLVDHGRTVTGALRTAVQLAGAIRRTAPDVVHAQNVKSAAISRAATVATWPRRRPPVLATFHGVTPAEYRRSARLLSHVDHVACVSSSALEHLLAVGLPASRASVVHNAVTPAPPLDPARRAELDREFGLTEKPVVAIVGRLVAQKAHERFVIAARAVADALPETRFLVVGDGPRRRVVETQVAAAGLTRQVLFTGVRSDARDIIARADVIVFSSDWEGLSITALEALAAGTPVVSTDVQGMRELLVGDTRVAGAVVPLDDGTALGERVAALLCDEHERAAMGLAGRELSNRDFSLDGMIDAYERLYERLMGN